MYLNKILGQREQDTKFLKVTSIKSDKIPRNRNIIHLGSV